MSRTPAYYVIEKETLEGFVHYGPRPVPTETFTDNTHEKIPIPEEDKERAKHLIPFEMKSLVKRDANGQIVVASLQTGEAASKMQRAKLQSSGVLLQRNAKLAQCDWTQVFDCPLTDEQKGLWQTYRQQLRDLPESIVYGDDFTPSHVPWPDAPN